MGSRFDQWKRRARDLSLSMITETLTPRKLVEEGEERRGGMDKEQRKVTARAVEAVDNSRAQRDGHPTEAVATAGMPDPEVAAKFDHKTYLRGLHQPALRDCLDEGSEERMAREGL